MVCDGPTVPAAEVIKQYGQWKEPSEDLGRSKHSADNSHHQVFDAFSTKVRELKEFGVGHMLYFHFLRWNALLFLVLAVAFGIPQMAANGAGIFYVRGDFEKTMLGNYGLVGSNEAYGGGAGETMDRETEAGIVDLFHDAAVGGAATVSFFGVSTPKDTLIVAMSILDAIANLLYFLACIAMIWGVRKLAKAADTNSVTLHDYSIMAAGIPADATADELEEFFSQYGQVVKLELTKEVDHVLQLFRKRQRMLQSIDLARARMQRTAQLQPEVPLSLVNRVRRLEDKLAVINDEIRQAQSRHGEMKAVAAFVTFQEEEAKEACLKVQPRTKVAEVRLKAEHKFRGRVALRIGQAPEASDIKYENLEYSFWQIVWRGFLSNLLKYSALLVGFILMELAPAIRYKVAADTLPEDKAACNAGCNLKNAEGEYDLAASDRTLYKDCAGALPSDLSCKNFTICYECFCRFALNAMQFDEAAYCRPYIGIISMQTISQMVAVLGVTTINICLFILASHLSDRVEKHKTRTGEARSLAQALFVMQFLNTALSPMLANMYLPFLQSSLEGSSFEWLLLAGIYSDLTPTWYRNVGQSIFLSVLIGIALKLLKPAQRWVLTKFKYRQRHKLMTQAQMDAVFQMPDFELAERYGEHLNIIFVVMFFSSGMPIMYVLGAINFAAAFYVERYELLKLSRRPTSYDENLAALVASLQPWAALLHIVFATWAFSIFKVGQDPTVTESSADVVRRFMTAIGGLWRNITDMEPAAVASRLLQRDAFHNFVTLLLMLATVLTMTLSRSLWRWGRTAAAAAGWMREDEETALEGVPEFTVAVRSKLLVGADSYAIKSNRQYAQAFSEGLFDTDPNAKQQTGADEAAAAAAAKRKSGGGGGGGKQDTKKASKGSRRNKVAPELHGAVEDVDQGLQATTASAAAAAPPPAQQLMMAQPEPVRAAVHALSSDVVDEEEEEERAMNAMTLPPDQMRFFHGPAVSDGPTPATDWIANAQPATNTSTAVRQNFRTGASLPFPAYQDQL